MAHSLGLPGVLYLTQGIQQSGSPIPNTLLPHNNPPHSLNSDPIIQYSPQSFQQLKDPAFDDHRLVANAGLLLPATLAQHLGLPELVQQCLDLGRAPGRANAGDKMMTLIVSALAGGDCIDGADALRAGADGRCSRLHGQGAIHPGHFPAQLSLGARPSTRPRKPGVAGTGLAGPCRTRRRAADHRPRLHHLRDLWTNLNCHGAAASGPWGRHEGWASYMGTSW